MPLAFRFVYILCHADALMPLMIAADAAIDFFDFLRRFLVSMLSVLIGADFLLFRRDVPPGAD